MKTLLITLITLIAPLQAFALSYVPPQIKGNPTSQTGETDQKSVRCILKEDASNSGCVRGELIVSKEFLDLDLGINLAVWDSKGNLVASWTITGREKDGKMHYNFLLKRELIQTAKFDLFTDDQKMMQLRLRTIPIQEKGEG